MAVTALPTKRSIIIGAGASKPYDLPLASELLKKACDRVARLDARRLAMTRDFYVGNEVYELAQGDNLSMAFLTSIKIPLTLERVARTFREHLVQQNLDDFVRDHPSLTGVVSMLITINLIASMYGQKDGMWQLRSELQKSAWKIETDWMRRFVGIIRPMASANNKLSIISFNYDALLERSMRMYWAGSEFKYTTLDESVEFVYPHGRFSELPERINNLEVYLTEQAAQLKVGEQRDQAARDRAKEIIKDSTRIFSVGFSFSDNNLQLLGLGEDKASALFVQNHKNEDVRLTRKLDQYHISSNQRDGGDMNSLVQNGFLRTIAFSAMRGSLTGAAFASRPDAPKRTAWSAARGALPRDRHRLPPASANHHAGANKTVPEH